LHEKGTFKSRAKCFSGIFLIEEKRKKKAGHAINYGDRDLTDRVDFGCLMRKRHAASLGKKNFGTLRRTKFCQKLS